MIQDDHDALHRVHRQFRQAERMANIGSWRLTLADNHVEWSDQVFAIHGLPVGASPPLEGALGFYPRAARSLIEAAIARTLETGQPFDVETDFVTANGDERRVRSMGELELHDGVAIALIGVFQDITERHRAEQALRRSASTDMLTGLANRASFNAVLDSRIDAARRSGASLALLLIDLDGFKNVNDRLGHRRGDDLLVTVGQRLQASYLADCFAARLGGDEFTVIVSTPDDCARLDALIEQILEDLQIAVDDLCIASATVGAAWLDPSVAASADLVGHADDALYVAKRARRGTASVFGRGPPIFARGERPMLRSVA